MTGAKTYVAVVPLIMLIGATLAAIALEEGAADGRLATTLIIVIASLKIRLVIAHFMELRWSVRPWRQILEVWLLAVTTVILAAYWLPLL